MQRETAARVMEKIPVVHVDVLFLPKKKYPSYKLISLYTAIADITLPGDYAEFGVYKGRCARFLTNFVFLTAPRTLHLFDSFEGLPEDWVGHWKKGHFDLKGKVPKFDPKRTRVYKGWFSDTVPPFARSLERPISFIHMDADLYQSTMDVLEPMNERIAPGTIILFDEYIMNDRDDEHRALWDWAEKYERRFEYLWRTKHVQVAIKVTE
jgi:hypothetical protein